MPEGEKMDSDSNESIKNTDDLNPPAPPPYHQEVEQGQAAPPPPQVDGQTNQEKKSNKKSMAVKISLGLLAIVLILSGYLGVKVYKKMKQMKQVFDYVETMASYSTPTDLPIPKLRRVSSEFNKESSRLFGESGTVTQSNNTGMPSFSMSEEDAKTFVDNARKIDGDKIMKAMNKYSERPIVKEFMNDLKKDPEFQKALAAKNSNNPLAVIESIHKIKNMKGIMGKYAMHPDFMKLMIDVMQDPEMKPLFKMMPGGMPNLSDSDIKNVQTEMENQPGGNRIEEGK